MDGLVSSAGLGSVPLPYGQGPEQGPHRFLDLHRGLERARIPVIPRTSPKVVPLRDLHAVPELLCVENLNGTVDKLFDSTALRRVIAQVEVSFSNSLIEARSITPQSAHETPRS